MGSDDGGAQWVECNLCGSTEWIVEHPAGRAQRNQIVRCRSCGLLYANPRSFLVDHEDYERRDVEHLLDGVETDRDHEYRWRYDKEVGQTRDYDKSRQRLNELYPGRGRLLEVGCSMGQLLQRFRADGWAVEGVDPWKEAAAYAQGHGIPCRASTLEDAAFPDASFDVVVMLHVIEHVPDPRATLAEINRVLRPGGHLLLETPRLDGVMYRTFGRRERSISCDGHIYFFGFETLAKLCEASGFEVIDHEFNGRTLSASRLLWNVGVMSKSEGVARRIDTISDRLDLDRIRLRVNLRDMQRLLVRKVPTVAPGETANAAVASGQGEPQLGAGGPNGSV